MAQNTPTTSGTPSGIGRRHVLKVAFATAPLIVTLPSGAALARSSNVIGASSAAAAIDSKGRTLCLDATSGVMDSSGSAMDLGASPKGSVTAITEREYHVDAKGSAALISEGEVCNKGGTYYYQSSGWQKVDVPRGMLVSATALSSFAGSIYYREV
jgi:hypothetical protein